MSMGIDCAVDALNRAMASADLPPMFTPLTQENAGVEMRDAAPAIDASGDVCEFCDEIDDEAGAARARQDAVNLLVERTRAGDPVALEAVSDLLTIPDLPVDEHSTLTDAVRAWGERDMALGHIDAIRANY